MKNDYSYAIEKEQEFLCMNEALLSRLDESTKNKVFNIAFKNVFDLDIFDNDKEDSLYVFDSDNPFKIAYGLVGDDGVDLIFKTLNSICVFLMSGDSIELVEKIYSLFIDTPAKLYSVPNGRKYREYQESKMNKE